MLTFRAGLLGAAVILSMAATAPGARANDSICDGFSTLQPNNPLSHETVTSAFPRVSFVKSSLDQKGCPSSAAECRDRAYLVPGDQVIVSRTVGDFACASYVHPKGLVRAGWLPRTALVSSADRMGTRLEDWVGRWRTPEQSLVIQEAVPAGRLKIQGEATFGASGTDRVNRGAVNTGSIEATAKPDGSSLAFTISPDATLPYDQGAETDCRVRLRLLGPFLLAQDNGNCGGLNVSFSGAYRKVTASKSKVPAVPAPGQAHEVSDLPVIADEIQQAEAFCRENGAALRHEPGFATLVDLDRDGRPDLVLDDNKVGCTQGSQPSCGSGGCTVRVLLATGSGFKPIFEQVAVAHRIVRTPKGMRLIIEQKAPYGRMVFRFAQGCAIPTFSGGERSCGS